MRSLLALLGLLAVVPATASAAPTKYYLSVGDSYAVGYQPRQNADGSGGSTTDGYADQLPALAKARGYKLKLRNFGCGGATTESLLKQKGCTERGRPASNRVNYSGTQADAVVKFLKKNRARTELVTIIVSGNDVTKCAKAENAVTCVGEATTSINKNLKVLLKRIRAAGGKKLKIVGLTYPDVILGEWVKGTDAARDLAKLSQVAFKSIINPALKKQYAAVKGTFIDVTKATDGYDPLDGATANLPEYAPYSLVPRPVATICTLTWYCKYGDIHAKRTGYRVMAKLIAATLPKRTA
jgi:lysophospholipase L1-like esterase